MLASSTFPSFPHVQTLPIIQGSSEIPLPLSITVNCFSQDSCHSPSSWKRVLYSLSSHSIVSCTSTKCSLVSALHLSYLYTYHDNSDSCDNKNVLSTGVLCIRAKGFAIYFHLKMCLSDKQSPYVCMCSVVSSSLGPHRL